MEIKICGIIFTIKRTNKDYVEIDKKGYDERDKKGYAEIDEKGYVI